jgi:hypothetical protein
LQALGGVQRQTVSCLSCLSGRWRKAYVKAYVMFHE